MRPAPPENRVGRATSAPDSVEAGRCHLAIVDVSGGRRSSSRPWSRNRSADVDKFQIDTATMLQSGGGRDDDHPPSSTSSPLLSTVALCCCTLCQGYLLISPFPYSGFMAMDLVPDLNRENAGGYAGWISSAFMVGRAFSSYPWGRIADVYGRRFVLFSSLSLSIVFSVMFGMSPTYRWAISTRFMLGLCNGMIGTVKTVVSELAAGDEKLETRGMGLVIGMWGWGFLISPAISGTLAEPMTQYPDAHWFQGRFDVVLARFPFLLPNLVSVAFCLASLVSVAMFVPETLPDSKRRSGWCLARDAARYVCGLMAAIHGWVVSLRPRTGSGGAGYAPTSSYALDDSATKGVDRDVGIGIDSDEGDAAGGGESDMGLLRFKSCSEISSLISSPRSRASYSSALHRHRKDCNGKESPPPSPPFDTESSAGTQLDFSTGGCKGARWRSGSDRATISSLWRRESTRRHMMAYWIFSFVAVCVDEAFPLFCLSKEAGLGLSEASIGEILTGSGILFVACQYFIFADLTDRFGLYPSLVIGSVFSSPLIILVPVSLLLDRGARGDGDITLAAFIFLSVLMAAVRVLGSVFFAGITIATNRTVEASHRATMNGLSMLGGSVAKAAGPAFAGYLVAFCASSGTFAPRVGSGVAFSVISVLGLLAAGYACLLSDGGDGGGKGESKEES